MSESSSVSIIIPVYNAEPYLRRCLDSVRAQTLRDWECICVDDGSTDSSGAILDEYAEKDSRFNVLHKQNGGISSARNAGIEVARGEYIGFIDNDDWIEPETYELALDAARQNDVDLVQWRFVNETKNGPRLSKEMPECAFDFSERPDFCSDMIWNKIFRRSFIFEKQIRFPLASKIGGEDYFFSNATYVYTKKAYSLNRVLYHLDRTHISTSSRKVTVDEIMGHVAVTKEACAYLELLANRETEKQRNRETEKQRNRETEKQRKQALYNIIFDQKVSTKFKAIYCIQPPDYRLFRSVFPELNWQMLPRFLKLRTKGAFIQLLYAWHLEAVVNAIIWVKRMLRSLAGRG